MHSEVRAPEIKKRRRRRQTDYENASSQINEKQRESGVSSVRVDKHGEKRRGGGVKVY